MGRLSKTKWCLLGCLIVLFMFVVGSVFVPNKLNSVVEGVANNDFAFKLRAMLTQEADQESTLTEMVVETIGVSKINLQPVVILREKGGELYLPIWIGPLEANAISVVLEGVEIPRPLTPDLLLTIIDRMGARVSYIAINDIQENTFYSIIALEDNWIKMEIDARPSDAIAIALRVGAPIYAEKAILDKAGIHPEQKKGKYTIAHIERDSRGI